LYRYKLLHKYKLFSNRKSDHSILHRLKKIDNYRKKKNLSRQLLQTCQNLSNPTSHESPRVELHYVRGITWFSIQLLYKPLQIRLLLSSCNNNNNQITLLRQSYLIIREKKGRKCRQQRTEQPQQRLVWRRPKPLFKKRFPILSLF